jgi:hypothetical protein
MGSCAVIYIPSLIKIGSGVQKLIGGGDKQTHTKSNNETHAHTDSNVIS